MNARAHVFISGKVQGVFFRQSTKHKALELGLAGWVRNLDDGRVEAVFEGEKDKVETMIQWCKKGPELAVVKDIEIISEKYTGKIEGFMMQHIARSVP